jgi:hypothetical protein
MDVIKLSIPATFITDRAGLTWREVLFGVDNELVSPETAIDLAIHALENGTELPAVIELASLSKTESTRPLVEQLANAESEQELTQVREKWLYLVLAWIFEHRNEYPEPLQVVEEVYADFDYPKEVAAFIRYMPMAGPDRGSRQENNRQLYENWEEYIRNKAVQYAGH